MDCQFRGQVPLAADVPVEGLHGHLHAVRVMLMRLTRARLPDPRAVVMSDLEEVLDKSGTATAEFLADLSHFGDLLETHTSNLRLEICRREEEGRVWVSACWPDNPPEVRAHDVFVQGVLFTGDASVGQVRVACRLVRLICLNGAVMPAHSELGTPVYERYADGGTVGDLDEVFGVAAEGRVVRRATALLQRAAAAFVRDLTHALVVLGLAGRVRLPSSVARAFEAEGDFTVYGAWNAVTRAARDAETLVERESLERLAGEMVARLYGIPAAAGTHDLQPV